MAIATNKAWCIGSENVMAWFDDNVNGKPYWSLWMGWTGKNLLTSYCSDDAEKSAATLRANIETAEAAGVDDTYMLKLHNTCKKTGPGGGGYIENKTPYYASLPFRPCALPAGTNMGQIYPTANSQGAQLMLPDYQYQLKAMMDKIEGIEDAVYNEGGDDGGGHALPPPVPEPAKVGALETLLGNPQIIGAITQIGSLLVERLIGFVLPPGGFQPAAAQAAPQPAGIGAVIEVSDKLKQALAVLGQYTPTLDEDLLRLANLAQSNPQLFQTFLAQLRGGGG